MDASQTSETINSLKAQSFLGSWGCQTVTRPTHLTDTETDTPRRPGAPFLIWNNARPESTFASFLLFRFLGSLQLIRQYHSLTP